MTPASITARIERAVAEEDTAALEALHAAFVPGGSPARPFGPALRLRETGPDAAMEGDVAVALANGLSRAIRLVRYRRRRRAGYTGPVIVSEGDSWFQYPILLADIVDHLSEPFAVRSLGAAGDTLAAMLESGEHTEAVEAEGADVFLLSASGNDVLGDGRLSAMLHDFEPGMTAADLVRGGRLAATLDGIEAGYVALVSAALAANPRLAILIHGYDRPLPRPGGRWLGAPMAARGIPEPLHRGIAGLLIDRLNERLAAVARRFPGRVAHVDLRGHVGGSAADWHDELHPCDPGFRRAAGVFEARIREMVAEAPRSCRPAVRVASGAEEGRHLSPDDRAVVADCLAVMRARSAPEDADRLETRRRLIARDDPDGFERVLGASNLFPISYLRRGAEAARAVAKIRLTMAGGLPAGSGSGFLVGPRLLLTNNHVLPDRETAHRAEALFDYEEGEDFRLTAPARFRFTGEIFRTSPRTALDYTLVSLTAESAAGEPLAAFGHLALVEASGKAVKGEAVSIVQHPRGGPKAIALRDSTILGVSGDFVYYTTDTAPGSSGSPVLNDQWLPVALHHRAVPHPRLPGAWIANRGVRISRILADLRHAAASGDRDAVAALQRLV